MAAVLVAFIDGAVDPNTAHPAAYVLQVERKIPEGVELEKRIETVEGLLRSRAWAS